ncbi:M16 family metallopeptidase, partial [Pedobacter sp.]|uniref:M16 family metallopeptidase n=1 Tax=Pedobacter sp. TaxID=1411316 RepID=UPI003C361869
TASLSEKNKTPSLNFVNDYKEMFLNGAAAPGMEWQVAFVKKILPEISLDEITAFSNKCLRGINTDILVLGPENEKTSLPDSTVISSWITEIESSKIPSFEDEILPRQLPLISRSRGKIISSKEIKALGVTYLQLSNGINVLLKPTDFKNDQIYFRGFRQGGTSLYDDSRVDNAAYAGALMSRFGLGDFNSTQLAGILNGKIVSVSSNILSRSEVVNGGSSHADLETALHIAHLQFTSSGKDTSMFKNIISDAKESVNGRKLDPQAQFTDTITAVTGNYAYRNQPVTAQRLDNIDVRDVLQIYKERFSDASGFTFTFVGSFNVDSIKPLIEIYLASLPSLKKRHRAKDLGIHIPSGQFSKTVFSGSENKASVRLVFSGNHQYTAQNNLRLKALGDILQDRVLHRLRELEGGVYSASVQVAYAKIPSSRYALNVSFGCAPDNVEHLIASVLEEMENIVQNGVSEDDILKFKAAYSKNVELALGDNSFWLNYLSGQIENKENLMEVNAQTSILSALNREAVATAASKYFSQENLIRFLLLPKYSAKPKTD